MSNAHQKEKRESVPLSAVESYFWRFEQDLFAFRVGVLTRLDGVIDARYLETALTQLQSRHPKLQARISEGRDGRLRYEFAPVPPRIPFTIADCDAEEPTWREDMCRLLSQEFPETGPLALVHVNRNRVKRSSDLVVVVTHAFADGLSAIRIVSDLLSFYARAEAGADAPPEMPLRVVSAGRAKSSATWRSRLSLFSRFLTLKRAANRKVEHLLPEAQGIKPLSQWDLWVFSPETTLALTRRCRKERTTISGVLIATICCALIEHLEAQEFQVRWQLPFNLRDFIEAPGGPVDSHDLGCFISNMNGLINVTQPPSFWDIARMCHEEIETFMKLGGPSFAYNMASFSYRLSEDVRRMLGLPPRRLSPSENARVTLLVTSYGVIHMADHYGTLKPTACTLAFKNEKAGPSLVLEALVLGQSLNVGLAGDSLEPALWEHLRKSVPAHLENVGRKSMAVSKGD